MRNSASPQRSWIFDLDGTLVDSFALYFESIEQLLGEHGIAFTPEIRAHSLREVTPSFLAHYLGEKRGAASTARFFAMSQEKAKLVRPFPGIEELLIQLQQEGARMAIWTSRERSSTDQVLESTGLGRFIESRVSGTCVAQHKPHQEGMIKLAAHFGCAPDQFTMVGDHDVDMLAAKGAGAMAVRASWHTYWDLPNCEISDHQFRSVNEFSTWALLHNKN